MIIKPQHIHDYSQVSRIEVHYIGEIQRAIYVSEYPDEAFKRIVEAFDPPASAHVTPLGDAPDAPAVEMHTPAPGGFRVVAIERDLSDALKRVTIEGHEGRRHLVPAAQLDRTSGGRALRALSLLRDAGYEGDIETCARRVIDTSASLAETVKDAMDALGEAGYSGTLQRRVQSVIADQREASEAARVCPAPSSDPDFVLLEGDYVVRNGARSNVPASLLPSRAMRVSAWAGAIYVIRENRVVWGRASD